MTFVKLTDNKGRKKSMVSSVEAYKRLAAYENTGLTPEDIKAMLESVKNNES